MGYSVTVTSQYKFHKFHLLSNPKLLFLKVIVDFWHNLPIMYCKTINPVVIYHRLDMVLTISNWRWIYVYVNTHDKFPKQKSWIIIYNKVTEYCKY